MLKKAGIVVAAAAAGVLALSPLAFAGDKGHEDKGHHGDKGHSQVEPEAPVTDIDYTNVETDNQTNDCEFGQTGPEVDTDATGGSAFLGAGGLVANAVAPITAQTQLLNCNNVDVSDVLDFDSNNTDTETTSTEVEESFNSIED